MHAELLTFAAGKLVTLKGEIMTTIEIWKPDHPRWHEVQALADATNHRRYLDLRFDWHLSNHIFVALLDDKVVGLLHYAVQFIGDDNDCPRVTLNGKELLEGKVMGFAVQDAYRRRGVGTALQTAAIDHARTQGCFQLRSHSGGDKLANHQLKLTMGFTVHPIIRGDDNAGAYFIMPLTNNIYANS